MAANSSEGEERVNTTSNSDKSSKRTKKSLVFLVVFFFIITVVTTVVLFIRSSITPKDILREEHEVVREVVQDLYPGKSIEVVEPLFVRARFARLEGNVLTYGVFSPVGSKTTDVTLNEKTVFGCIHRYMIAPDGTQIDRLSMFITSEGKEDIGDIPDPPNSKKIDWFKANVKNGEAIEIRYVKTSVGKVIPRIIYIYEDSCPS